MTTATEERKKFIIVVNGEGLEIFEGNQKEAEERAWECWLDTADQDYAALPYTKQEAEEYGLEDDGE